MLSGQSQDNTKWQFVATGHCDMEGQPVLCGWRGPGAQAGGGERDRL